jgi:indolepyruvate ferredoxin oxidoreductase, alpha subunit
VDIETLVRSIGYDKLDVVDPYDMDKLADVLQDHLKSGKPSVIIAKRPCVLYTKEKKTPPVIDTEECTNCGTCLDLGCSPLVQEEDYVTIDPINCNGCGLCVQVCPAEAIK